MCFSPSVGDAECFEPQKASANAAGRADRGLQTDWDTADFEVPLFRRSLPAPTRPGPGLPLPLRPPPPAPCSTLESSWDGRAAALAPRTAPPTPPTYSTLESSRDGQAAGASTADSARPRGAPIPAPPWAPFAVRCRGPHRPLETPLSQAPCLGLVNVSGRCCSDLTRNLLWTWGFACCVSFSEGRSRRADKQIDVFTVAADWLSFNGKAAALFSGEN